MSRPTTALAASLSLALLSAAAGSLAQSPPPSGRLVRPSASGAPSGSAASSGASPGVSPSARPAAKVDPGFAPDPAPLVTRRKWVYQIHWREGAVFVPTPRLVEKPRPTETPRAMGRFALELWVGKELVERVRFELPGLDGDVFSGQKRPRDASPDMERKIRLTAQIEVPDSDRATYAVLVDRATGAKTRVPWVPTDFAGAGAASASASARPAKAGP